jgi:hypothetical protein
MAADGPHLRQHGHSSVQLTLDTYRHLLPDLMLKERAAAKLDAILSGGNDNPGQNPRQTDPARVVDQEKSSNSFEEVVSQTFVSWNQIATWLRRLEGLRDAA